MDRAPCRGACRRGPETNRLLLHSQRHQRCRRVHADADRTELRAGERNRAARTPAKQAACPLRHQHGVGQEGPRATSTSIGMSHMLTGDPWTPARGYEKPGGDQYTVGFAGGISVDQHIAKQVGTTDQVSLARVRRDQHQRLRRAPFSRMISAGQNQPVPAEDDPAAMFKRVFTDGISGGWDDRRASSHAQREACSIW